MANGLSVTVDPQALQRLINRFGQVKIDRIRQVTINYTERLARESKKIIRDEKHIDTGRTVNSISPNVRIYGNRILGQVNAGTKYARFVHEGAEHLSDTQIVPHFVPFNIAPSLLLWAKRNKVVYQKTKTGAIRKGSKKGDKWYMKSKSGKEYRIDIKKGGLPVMMKPTLFFKIPFDNMKNDYVRDVTAVMLGS